MAALHEDDLLPTYRQQIAVYLPITDEEVANALLRSARQGSTAAEQRFVEGTLYRVVDLLPDGLTGSEALDRIQATNSIILAVLSDYEGPSPLQEIDQRVGEVI